MPEAEVKKEEVKEEKTVDIDTSGPDVDIAIPEEKDLKGPYFFLVNILAFLYLFFLLPQLLRNQK